MGEKQTQAGPVHQERTGQKTRRSRAFRPHTLPRKPTIFLTAPLSHAAMAHTPWPMREASALPRTRNQFEVKVPSQSIVDIQTSQEERPGASGTSGQKTGTVLATVVAADTLTNRVKVQTQAGQVIELDTPAKDRQIGEQVTLIVPR